jgi:hypothetical protein
MPTRSADTSMLPLAIHPHFTFYKYPGSISVKGSIGGSQRVLPIEFELHLHIIGRFVSGS